MWIVVWNDERLQEFEKSFYNIDDATYFMEDLPDNAQLFWKNGALIERII